MSSTGRFRTGIIAAAGVTRESVVPPAAAAPTMSGAAGAVNGSPYADWADRVQRAHGRHAAITRNLYSWSSYKNWAEKVKDSWRDEPAEKDGVRKPGPR